MQFEMTPQRVAYFSARGKIILNACPGSGKTTCIIHKLALLEKECLQNHGSHAGIVCLSFTNVAKNEILHKYKEVYGYDFRFPHLVSTIDSFINQYITLPYYNLLNKDLKRPQIIDQAGIIDKLVKVRFQYKGKWMDGIQPPMNKYKNRAGKPIYLSYPPGTIWIDVNGHFTFQGKAPNPALVDPLVFQAYGKDLFHWKIKRGLITSLDSAYIALSILKKHENIGRWLVKRFPYMIIDEAQDNSEIQHALFDKLVDLGLTNIELIGDPYQSLYEWRDAKPQLFLTAAPLSRRLLLAEDNAVNAEIIEAMLAARGYDVVTVEDGAAAVDAWKNFGPFDLCLMDLQMPIMDGLTATTAIRVREVETHARRLPIVGLTANILAEDVARCLEAGMDAHAAKPVVWPELFKTIEQLTNNNGTVQVARTG